MDALSADMPADIQSQIDAARAELDQEAVDYEGTMGAKKRIARAVFEAQGGPTLQVRGLRSQGLGRLQTAREALRSLPGEQAGA